MTGQLGFEIQTMRMRDAFSRALRRNTWFWGTLALLAANNSWALSLQSALSEGIELKDERGQDFQYPEVQGKRVVLTMTYTGCLRTCPLTINALKKLESHLHSRAVKAEFVLISLDPKGDTPERRKLYYRQQWGLTSSQWHFLASSPKGTQILAKKLGINYTDIDEHIIHDNKILIFDEKGDWQKTLTGWDFELEEIP